MTDYARARRAMVDNQLRTSGITDRRILAAMGDVPRELFVPEARRGLAYVDAAHSLAGQSGRSLAAPAPFARILQLAEVAAGHCVLDIGAGAGYSSAVLGHLAGEVVALESDAALAGDARRTLAEIGAANVQVEEGPLAAGAPQLGPYDVIVLEGAVSTVPAALFDQLREGGRLVAVVGAGAAPTALLYVRSRNDVAARAAFNVHLPPLERQQAAEPFVF